MLGSLLSVVPRLELPPIGLGTYENTDPEVCADSVETALNAGYRHVDTAEMYGNEAAVGEAIARADVDRDDVVVATKIEPENLAYGDLLESARGCADRLGIDTIDLLYVHWPLEAYEPQETLGALDHLVDEGLADHVGLSNFTPSLLEEAIRLLDTPLAAHQVECHALLQQDELRRLAREHDHHLVAYSPLAKGELFDEPEIRAVADDYDATPAQVALAWLLAKDSVVPIPKASTPDHIRENLAATELSLDPIDVERIDAIDRERRVVDFEGTPW